VEPIFFRRIDEASGISVSRCLSCGAFIGATFDGDLLLFMEGLHSCETPALPRRTVSAIPDVSGQSQAHAPKKAS